MEIDAIAEKYERKRTGLTCDEALEATVLGYRVRAPSIPRNAYVHYTFDSWRLEFEHDGVTGSSSRWTPDRDNFLEEWSIVPLPSEVKRDKWGRPI